ncbi:MAG: 6-phosphofructokinase [Clostridiaceae bacterium]|nr:6-phosphofructokinase [Clostridiaceae bacterium]
MAKLVGNAIFGQSGGPTSVINASAAGVFTEALKNDCIPKVYGAAHGIRGILEEKFYDMSQEDPKELELLKTTPSSALGSVRYKLADPDEDPTDYNRLLEVFKKYDIRYFFYNGGNDSMDTCNKVSKFMQKAGYECRVIGVPKTIDNDLYATDHCPGYASAAKYVATATMEIYHDASVYDTPMVCVLEVMGRNAGWLTAATALATYKGQGPDLIYLPELVFDVDKFIADCKKVFEKNNGKLIVAVSEGVKDKDGRYISEYGSDLAKEKDSFGHAQLGGTGQVLANILKKELKCKTRHIEFSLLQRCAAHWASATDVEEAFTAGQKAVQFAVEGYTDYMVGYERAEKDGKYICNYKLIELSKVANTEKKIPREWINEDGTGLNPQFIDYVLPLIEGESKPPIENGLPRFAKLKKVLATK